MVYKYAHNFTNYFHQLTHIFLFPLSFVLLVYCLTMRSHVMYTYKCQGCGALYNGQTRQHVHTRISEHIGVSSKTGNKLSVSQTSAFLTHHHL